MNNPNINIETVPELTDQMIQSKALNSDSDFLSFLCLTQSTTYINGDSGPPMLSEKELEVFWYALLLIHMSFYFFIFLNIIFLKSRHAKLYSKVI